MAGRLVDNGEDIALRYLVGKTASTENLVLRLYKSNTTPADADVAGTYTEADFTGYSAVTLTGASWTVTPGDPTTASYAQQSFASSANQTAQSVYGYYVTRASTGDLVFSERFSTGPFTIQNNGDTIKVTPALSMVDDQD